MGKGNIKIRRTFDEIELTADDVLDAIEELSIEERLKVLDEISFKYFNDNSAQRIIIEH